MISPCVVRRAALAPAVCAAVIVLAAGCAPKQNAETAHESPPPAQSESAAPPAPFAAPVGAVAVGNAFTQPTPVRLSAVRADMPSYLTKTVLVEATADRVCQSKGCWMTVTDGDGGPIWVRWSSGCGGAFAFPKDAAGKRVIVEGTLSESEITQEAAEHYASESPGMDASKIVGKTFEINATAFVLIPEAPATS
jgi:hypothetical protein